MSGNNKTLVHMVVLVTLNGPLVCMTNNGEPAVFNDTPPAELLCAQLRESAPQGMYRVLSFPVL